MRLSNSRWFSYFFVFGALALNACVAQQFSIATTQAQISEASGFAGFTITANTPVADGVEVDFTLTGVSGSATYGVDFSLPTNPETISIFGDGETTSWDFPSEVSIVDDTLFELSETFQIRISNPTVGTLGTSSVTFTITNNDPQPRLFLVAANTSEPAGTVTLTFQLRNAANAVTTSGADTTFTWSTSDGTATGTNNPVGAQDFIAQTNVAATIAAGQTQTTATVTIVNDNTHEAEEYFDITMSNVAGGASAPVSATVRFYITDDDAAPSIRFQTTSTTFPEEGVVSGGFTTSTVSLTLVLSAVSGVDVSVQYRTVAGTAVAGDFTSVPATTITFKGIKAGQTGETTRTITITVQDDQTYEPNESFTVELIAGTAIEGTIDNANSVVTITIIDNDPAPTLQVAVTPTLEENPDGSATTAAVTFTPSRISGLPITFNYATRSGNDPNSEFNAISGVDFTPVSGSATIPAGSTSATVVIPIIPDAKYERDEEFWLDITNWVGISGLTGSVIVSGSTGSSEITIPNNDPYPVLTIVGQNVSEPLSGSTIATFTVSIIGQTDLFSDVLLLTTGGTATDGLDFAWPANFNATYGRVTLPAGVSSATYEITIFADDLDEDDETYTVELIDPLGIGVGVNSRAEAFIFDSTPPPFCDFEGPSSVQEGASGTTSPMTFGISLSAESAKTVQVDVQFTAGTATADVDFQPSTVRLTWDPLTSTLSKDASVTVIGDDTNEGDETIIVTLVNPVNCQLRETSTTVGTIIDDDAIPTLGITSRTVTEGNNILVTATLSRPSAFDTRFTWWTVDVTASSALGPRNDYIGVNSATGTILAGATSVNLGTISTTNDPWDEPASETFQVRAVANTTNVPSGEVFGTMTINDNDPAPNFVVSPVTVSEGAGVMTFNVSLTLSGERTYTVDYATQLGVNGAVNAAESTDFTAVSGTLTYANFVSFQVVNIPINDDSIDEPDEFFNFVLSNPTPLTGGTPGFSGPSTVTGTITDNDPTPVLTVTLQPSVAEPVNSGAITTVTATFSLDRQSESTITYSYAWAGSGSFPASSADYNAVSGTVTFEPFATLKTVNIDIIGDGLDEYDETVTLTTSQSGATVDTKDLVIVDFNDPPQISIGFIGSVSEGVGTVTASITLSTATAKIVSFDIGVIGVDAEASDFSATTASLSSPDPWTYTFSIVDDSIDEYDEDVLVGLANIQNADPGTITRTVTIVDNDATPTIDLAIPEGGFTEGDSGLNVQTCTVTLSGPTEKVPFTLTWSTIIGSAPSPRADPTDLLLTSDFVTFDGSSLSADFDITIYGDVAYEGDENFQIQFSGNPTFVDLSINTFDETIPNDDPQPVISIDDQSATEGFSMTFTISLSSISSEDITFDICTSDDTADSSDYVAGPCDELTIFAGDTFTTYTVFTSDDSVYEGTETFDIDLTNIAGALTGDINGVGTILDDESLPALSISDIVVQEPDSGSTAATFTVSISPVSKFTTTFSFSTADEDAVAPADYIAVVSGSGSIAPFDSFTTISVTVNGDALYEDTQYFLVNLADANLQDGQAECAILDFESYPTVFVADAVVAESNQGQTATLNFAISITPAAESPISFSYSTINGDAVAGSDFVANSGSSTITSTATISVTVTGDNTYENDEDMTFSVSLAGSNTDIADGTITNDDPLPVVSIVSNVNVVEGNSGTTNAQVVLSLDRASEVAGSVNFNLAAGTATVGADYTDVSQVVTLTALQTSFTVNVPIVGDTLDEDDETITVSISNPSVCTLGTSSRTITIQDDDAFPSISINDPTVGEASGAGSFTVTMNQASGRTVSFNWALVSTPLLNVDFTMSPTSGTITIPAGQTSATIGFSIINDSLDEDDETFSVTISIGSPQTITVSKPTGTVTIIDDDAPPTINLTPGSVIGGVSGAAVVEPNQGSSVSMSFGVGLSAASGKTITISYGTSDGTATAPGDYTSATGTVTFNAGETSKTITVTVNGDNIEEDDETFSLNLSNPSNVALGTSSVQGTIVDNEPDVTVSIADKNCVEGNSGTTNCVFTVTSNVASQFAVSMNFATSAGTASNVRDYTDASGSVTIPALGTTATITIAVTGDTYDENDETFTVTLSSLSRGTFSDNSAVGTIVDDDAAPSVSFSAATYTTVETDANFLFPITIQLSQESGKTVTVNYAATSSSAVAGNDYLLASGSVTFTPGNPGETSKNVQITIVGDLVSEYSESFVVTLSSPSNANLGLSSTTVTINDNDPDPEFTLINDSPVAAEGDNGNFNDLTFVIQKTGATEKDFTVDYYTSADTAIEGVDYQGRSGTVTFGAESATLTITVPTIGDNIFEDDEYFDLNIDINDDSETMLTATATIQNDDAQPIVYMVTSDVSVMEGNSSTKTVTITVGIDTELSDLSSFDISVPIYYDDGSADSTGSLIDYVDGPDTVTIAAGQEFATFDVIINGDIYYEADEDFFITLGAPNNEAILDEGDYYMTVTILNDDAPPVVGIYPRSIILPEGTNSPAEDPYYTYTISLSGANAHSVVIEAVAISDTATAGSDFEPFDNFITFPPGTGVRNQTITIRGYADNKPEPDETFDVVISVFDADEALEVEAVIARNAGSAEGILESDDSCVIDGAIGGCCVVPQTGPLRLDITVCFPGMYPGYFFQIKENYRGLDVDPYYNIPEQWVPTGSGMHVRPFWGEEEVFDFLFIDGYPMTVTVDVAEVPFPKWTYWNDELIKWSPAAGTCGQDRRTFNGTEMTVNICHLTQFHLENELPARDPHLEWHYKVVCGDMMNPRIDGFFTSVTGISNQNEWECERFTHVNGREVSSCLPSQFVVKPLVAQRILTLNQELWDWRDLVANGDLKASRENCTILLYDRAYNPSIAYTIFNAWPGSIEVKALGTMDDYLTNVYGTTPRTARSANKRDPSSVALVETVTFLHEGLTREGFARPKIILPPAL